MTRDLRLVFPVVRGAALVLSGCAALVLSGCAATGEDTAAPSTRASAAPSTPASAAPASNTAEICESGGKAARDVVVNLFSQMAGAAGEKDPEAALAEVYERTFTALSTRLRTEAARATDPAFAAVLTGIAGEAAKVAADPESAGTDGFQKSLDRLDRYCPRAGAPSASAAAPGGAVDGVVGAPGSACELPVTFQVPREWKPKPVTIADDDPLAELGRTGDLRLACEIDAKPAGHLGFLRVWLDPAGGDAKKALRPFLADAKVRKVTYTPRGAGGLDGVEVRFEQYQKLLEEWNPHRAFAAVTPAGIVAFDLGGLDADEHEAMVPAFEQAVSTLAAR